MAYPDDIAARLKRARRLADLSQDQLGQRLGKSQQTIQRYETAGLPENERQADKLVQDWAEATRLTVTELLDLPAETREPEPEWVGEFRGLLTQILEVLRADRTAEAAMGQLAGDAADPPPSTSRPSARRRRTG